MRGAVVILIIIIIVTDSMQGRRATTSRDINQQNNGSPLPKHDGQYDTTNDSRRDSARGVHRKQYSIR